MLTSPRFKIYREGPRIQDLGIAYSTDYNSALALKERQNSVFPRKMVYIEQIGASLGAHYGQGAVFVAFR